MKLNRRLYLRHRKTIFKIIEIFTIVGALWIFFGAGYYLGIHDIHPFTLDNSEYQLR